MYVEYLDKLLSDIELHRHNSSVNGTDKDEDEEQDDDQEAGSLDLTVTSAGDSKLVEDEYENLPKPSLRSSLHLDLETSKDKETVEGAGKSSSFVTVISVTAADKHKQETENNISSQEQQQPGSNFTFTKSKSGSKKTDSNSETTFNTFGKKFSPPQLSTTKPVPAHRRHDSRESLNSVSSPLSPTSPSSLSENPLLSPREAPASPREHSLILGGDETSSESGSPSNTKLKKTKPEPPARSISIKDSLHETKSNSSSEDIDLHSVTRGRPDGGETDESISTASAAPTISSDKVKDLRANWENKPPISVKPVALERKSKRDVSRDSLVSSPSLARRVESKSRNNSDTSSRGRVSPSGKSHDSSDSENSWGRHGRDDSSPGAQRRRASGETRLERLVRKPSAEKSVSRQLSSDSSGPPSLPKPKKLAKKWPNTQLTEKKLNNDKLVEEPLYDTVANDEPEDDYDNHLLYGSNKKPADKSEEDIEEAAANNSVHSMTLSSSTDTDNVSGSPSLLRKVVAMDEEESNYVNIQYFLSHTKSRSQLNPRDRSLDNNDESDDDTEKGVRSPNNNTGSLESNKSRERSGVSEAERLLMYRHILTSITDSEAIYLECLSVSLQYMKAMKVTLSTPQPVIPKEDFDIIFFKIPELHEFHYHYHESLKKQVERYSAEDKIGHHFKMLAQQTKVYAQFLGNYPAALETLHKCTQMYPQFADLTGSIKLRTLKGQQQSQSLSLEDLLHKPVARVQKNCLSLQDLIKYTPEDHPDYNTLNDSLNMIQNFLNDYNVEHRGELYPHQERSQRHLVKNSFTVELSDGARKLRHLFLFNDVLVCAKYKASGRGEKFTFQLKWYIPLHEVSPYICIISRDFLLLGTMIHAAFSIISILDTTLTSLIQFITTIKGLWMGDWFNVAQCYNCKK